MHVDLRKYQYFVQQKIQIWLAFKLIPEYLKRNHENLQKLNDLLRKLKYELFEYKILKNSEDQETNYLQTMQPPFLQQNSQIYKEIQLENLLLSRISIESLYGVSEGSSKNKENERQIFLQLQSLLKERNVLDKYINVKGYKLEEIRLYVTSQLKKLQKRGFVEEISQPQTENLRFPQNQSILLQLFATSVLELNPYYSKVREIVIENKFIVNLNTEQDFFIQKVGLNQLVVFYGKQSLKFSNNYQDVFKIMVFFLFFMIKFQDKYNSLIKRDSALGELINELKEK